MTNANYRSTLGGACSAAGTTLMGIGVITQLSGTSSKLIQGITLVGFLLTAAGQFFGHLFAADAKTVSDLASQLATTTNAVRTGDTSFLTNPANPNPNPNPSPDPMKKAILPVLLCAGLAATMLYSSSCASVAPGADPIEVRAEQTIAVASDTFDELLKLEYQNVELVRSNAPAVHRFCEYMRQPVVLGTNTWPRDIAIIESATTVRKVYKANRNAANRASLISGLATVEASLAEAQKYMTMIGAPPAIAAPATPTFSPLALPVTH